MSLVEPKTGRYRLARQLADRAVFAEVSVQLIAAASWTFEIRPKLAPGWAKAAAAGASAARELLGSRFYVRLTRLRGMVVDTSNASVALATLGAILVAAEIATPPPDTVAAALLSHTLDTDVIPCTDDLIAQMTATNG